MKQIIAVVSGKGGVGKSTVAVNLAVALAGSGIKTALVDADFYGPSVPILMGGGGINADAEGRLLPAEKHGVKYVSIAFFLGQPDTPVIWRGPMLHKAMQQLFGDVNWGEIDCAVVDMPPGTGDAALSLAQVVKLTGAVVVTTPQEVAMADVRKALNMLRQVGVEVLGIVENMTGEIFGRGGGERLAQGFGVPLLASLPLETSIREGGDTGRPAALEKESPAGAVFQGLALKLIDILGTKQKAAPSLKIAQ